jgi:hypothetical protein
VCVDTAARAQASSNASPLLRRLVVKNKRLTLYLSRSVEEYNPVKAQAHRIENAEAAQIYPKFVTRR